MAKQLTEDELNLRRKARRRLIGAIVLALAVAVILPMVLDNEPKNSGQDIELRIPAPNKVGEFVPGVAVSEVAGTSPFAASTAASAVAISAVTQAEPPVTQAAPAGASAKQAVAASGTHAEAPAKTQTSTDKQPETKAADKPVGDEVFVAQVGAYANAHTAKQEADKLKKMGFKAYTEKIGDKTRVRVGPYTERERAEKARALLEKHGLHPVVTSVAK